MSLSVYLLGAPRFEHDSRPVRVGRRRVIALAAYLCLSSAPQSRELLASLFWPEHDHAEALKSLRRELARLRKALGDDVVSADRLHLELTAGKVWVDANEFQAHLDAVGEHGHGSQPCSDCQEKLAAAAALYEGEFMEGFRLDDCPEFERWLEYQRSTLRQRLAAGLQQLVDLYEQQGAHGEAIRYGQRWLWLNPLHEPAHRALMRLYAESGQRQLACQQYEQCVAVLAEEVGLAPAAETVALYEELCGRAQVQAPPPTQPVAQREERRIPRQLPPEITPFVGRSRELAVLLLRLREPTCRLLTLAGPGGIGKTRMAVEAARRLAETNDPQFKDGIYFVPLSQVESVEGVAPAILKAMGQDTSGNISPRDAVLELLRDRCLLLVLDNMEHLTPAAQLVSDILAVAPSVRILATSREALSLQEEWFHPVGGMAVPPLSALQASGTAVQEYDAIMLFAQAAERARVDFSLEAEAADVVRICRMVQGMPLALVLAASWRELLSSREIADELERSLDILEGVARNLPPRQRSVRAAFNYSWKRLPDEGQRVFPRLSVFRGGFTRDSARAVSGAGLHVLRALLKKSFLTVDSQGRYAIHELLRQFGGEKLAEANELHVVRATHSDYFITLLQECTVRLKGHQQLQALNTITTELENVRTAWNWAVQQGNEARIAQSLESVYLYFDVKGGHYEGAQFLRGASERLASRVGVGPGLVWARLMAVIVSFESHFRRDYQELELILEQALAIARAYGDEATIGFVLMAQGEVAGLVKHDLREAAALMEQSLASYHVVDDSYYIAYIYLWLGHCYAHVKGSQSQETYMREGLRLAQETDNEVVASNALALLADSAYAAGQFAEAEGYAEEAFEIGTELNLRGCIAHTQSQLALAHFLRGDVARASVLADRGLRLAREIRYAASEAYALAVLAGAAAIGEAYELGVRLSRQSVEAPAGNFARLMGHWVWALNAAGLGVEEEVIVHVRRAAEYAQLLGPSPVISWLLPPLAIVAARRGEPVAAVQLMALASVQSRARGAAYWMDRWPLFRRLRDALEVKLGKAGYEAAWRDGSALSLEAVLEEWLLPAQ
ncbi:MAG TPA: BTAD domain-containing putative transcriptional regulator [Candidatus Sulfomarinibacteraceae bacterium]|nr:BTAD domain-containing putative transcriptional regulator [Candidatus Sulfomarinibacteraceae bacterium]